MSEYGRHKADKASGPACVAATVLKKGEWSYLESLHSYGAPCVYRETNPVWVEHGELPLSLICPLYNSSKYIDSLLGSLMRQDTQHPYEIVLVDDGSKDNTCEKALEWQRRYPDQIRLIQQENKGISEARNAGIDAAIGCYLGFIDHDDIVIPEYVESLLRVALSEDADVVKCAYQELENGKVICASRQENMTVLGPMTEELFRTVGYVWGGIYRRDIFKNIRFPSGYWYEDMIRRPLLLRQSRKYVQLSKCLYYKTKSPNNASVKVWSNHNYKCIEHLYLIREIFNANDQLGLGQDGWFYRSMLRECTDLLHHRIRGLSREDRYQIFYCMSDLMRGIWQEDYKGILVSSERAWNKTILDCNFDSWNALAQIYRFRNCMKRIVGDK